MEDHTGHNMNHDISGHDISGHDMGGHDMSGHDMNGMAGSEMPAMCAMNVIHSIVEKVYLERGFSSIQFFRCYLIGK